MSGNQWTRRLMAGMAGLLSEAGAATWRGDGTPYEPGETPVVILALPQSPDRVVVLSTYPVDEDPTLSDSTIGLNVRTRAGPHDSGDLEDLADDVFDAFHGLGATTLATGVRIEGCWRQSSTTLGQDQNGRHQRSCNYYVQAHRPGTHRT